MADVQSRFDGESVTDRWSSASPRRGRLRAEAAGRATKAANVVSRRLGLGSGTVAGGRIGLAIDPGLLARLARGRQVALVSGTNGKTTTTALLARALEISSADVVTNATGANMPAGHLACLVGASRDAPAVLEVDEAYLATSLVDLQPAAVVLLNLSRDQLDRMNEVRMLAGRWRAALRGAGDVEIVANADDPLVVFGVGEVPGTRWVSAGGLGWRNDAAGCPACLGRITFDEAGSDGTAGNPPGLRGGWRCSSCGLARPRPHAWLDVDVGGDRQASAVFEDGRRIPLHMGLPGRFNQANALMSAVAAEALGIDAHKALEAMAEVHEVAGRFTVRRVGSVRTQLLLAKNPAGWAELLELVRAGERPIVVAINARIADGRDPSWLWDVPFEVLAGRTVVATGDRGSDLSVRLHYAGVEHRVVRDLVGALQAAAQQAEPTASPEPAVQFVGNYTAFHDLLRLR